MGPIFWATAISKTSFTNKSGSIIFMSCETIKKSEFQFKNYTFCGSRICLLRGKGTPYFLCDFEIVVVQQTKAHDRIFEGVPRDSHALIWLILPNHLNMHKTLYTRYPIVALGLPNASREQRYLAYNTKPCFCCQILKFAGHF